MRVEYSKLGYRPSLNQLNLSDMKLEHEWDFVQMYYPDYDHSDDILENDILARLVDREYVEGDMDDSAYEKLVKEYGGDIDNPKIEIDFKLSCAYIFEEAIKGYIAGEKSDAEFRWTRIG